MHRPDKNSHARPSQSRVQSLGRTALGVLVAFLTLTAQAGRAQAECNPPAASVTEGNPVTCSGPITITDAYTVPTAPSPVNEVTVTIEADAIFDVDGPHAVSINDLGGIINKGTVNVGTGGSTGLIAGDGLDGGNPITIQNAETGSISVLSAGAYGIQVGNFAEIELAEGSTLTLGENAAGSVGIRAESDGLVENFGDVTVGGNGATGFVLGARTQFGVDVGESRGTITLSGDSSVGISGSGDSTIYHWGIIESNANNTIGIQLADPLTPPAPSERPEVYNRGEMNFFGESAKGVSTGAYSNSYNGLLAIMNFEGPGSTAVESGDIGSSYNRGTITMSADNSEGNESIAVKSGEGTDLSANFAYAENGANGVITMSGDHSVGMEVGDFGQIFNDGQLVVTGDFSFGIRAGLESYTFNSRRIEISGTDSIGVDLEGRNLEGQEAGFENALGGSLVSKDPNAGPLIRLGAGLSENHVKNNGYKSDEPDVHSLISANVEAVDPTLNRGVAIQGSDGVDRITNGADIQGLVLLGGDDDIYESYITGQIADLGSGTLDGGTGEDTLDLTVDPDRPSSETGLFNLGVVKDFEAIRVSQGRWLVSGRPTPADSGSTNLVVASGGTLRIETPLSIPGDYSHEAPTEPSDPLARVEVVLTKENKGSGEALLQVEGTANLSNGELEIELGPGLQESGEFILVESGEDLTTEFDSIIEPEISAAEQITLAYTARGLEFTLQLAPMNANQTATSNYMQDLPDQSNIKSALDNLNYSEYLKALNQLMPEAYDAQADATLELANQYTDLLLSRPNYCVVKPGEDSVHPATQLACQQRAFEPWMNLYGQRHKRTGTDGHISYHDEGGGLVVGFDHRVNHQLLLTASAGVAYDIIHVDNVGKGRLGTVDIGFAASWADGPLRIQGAATYGYGWNTRYREVNIDDFSSRARGEYGMNRVGLRARAEYGFRLGSVQIAPLVSLDYTALIRPSITETEGGDANLYIDGTTNNITTVRVGLDLGSALHKDGYWTQLLENADGVWRPQLTVAWRQVVTGAHRDITSRLLGAPGQTFTIEANAADRGFEVGAGLDWSPAPINRFTFGVHYDAFVWENVLNQTIMGQVRFSF